MADHIVEISFGQLVAIIIGRPEILSNRKVTAGMLFGEDSKAKESLLSTDQGIKKIFLAAATLIGQRHPEIIPEITSRESEKLHRQIKSRGAGSYKVNLNGIQELAPVMELPKRNRNRESSGAIRQ